MIDLKKLGAQFDALFAQETEESFNEWLRLKQQKEIVSFLGKGYTEILTGGVSHLDLIPCTAAIMTFQCLPESPYIGENQYATAA